MTDTQVKLVKSDFEHVIDLAISLAGIGLLLYLQNPEPFERVVEKARRFAHSWVHRASVWEARQAIRSLPETDW